MCGLLNQAIREDQGGIRVVPVPALLEIDDYGCACPQGFLCACPYRVLTNLVAVPVPTKSLEIDDYGCACPQGFPLGN